MAIVGVSAAESVRAKKQAGEDHRAEDQPEDQPGAEQDVSETGVSARGRGGGGEQSARDRRQEVAGVQLVDAYRLIHPLADKPRPERNDARDEHGDDDVSETRVIRKQSVEGEHHGDDEREGSEWSERRVAEVSGEGAPRPRAGTAQVDEQQEGPDHGGGGAEPVADVGGGEALFGGVGPCGRQSGDPKRDAEQAERDRGSARCAPAGMAVRVRRPRGPDVTVGELSWSGQSSDRVSLRGRRTQWGQAR